MRLVARDEIARTERIATSEIAQPRPHQVLIWALALGASFAYFGLALVRHLSFHSAAYDLGFFDQVLWNASRGHGLRSTFIPYGFFGEHFEPALLLFIPIYRVVASPLWLLGAQSIALGLAAVPLHAIARRLLDLQRAWLVVGAYLLQLGIARAVASDFHTETLAVPFVFLAILFALQRRWHWFALFAIIPMLAKEDGVLVTIGIAILALIMTRQRISLVPAIAALGYGIVVLFWAMPVIRHGAPGDLVLRYAYLGSTPEQVVLHTLTRPWLWLENLASSPALPALLLLLAAVGFLPIFRPAAMGAALLPLIPAFLSTDPYQAGLRLQYSIPAVPLLMIAALLGWQRLPAMSGGVMVILGAAATWVVLGPVLPRLGTDVPGLGRAADVTRILRLIPSGDEVGASSNLVPHLSERPSIWEFPAGFGARWIVIDRSASVSQESQAHGYAAAIARLPAAGYTMEAEADGVTVWRKSP